MKKKELTLEQSNAIFNALAPAAQRVAIAEDVISQIKLKKFIAYTNTSYFKYELGDIDDGDIQLQLLLSDDNLNKTCSVCARGAVFASKVRLGNDCTINDVKYDTVNNRRKGTLNLDNRTINKQIEDIFSIEQLALMEAAFEGSLATVNLQDNFDVAFYEAVEFGQNITYVEADDDGEMPCEDGTDRMIAIMKNIIANKGTFKP